MKQLAFARPQAVQKPLALSFQVPALALPDCSSGSRVIFPSGVKVILNFAPEGDAAVNGCPEKKVAFMSFGAIGSAANAALAPKSIDIAITSRLTRSTEKSPVPYETISLAIYRKLLKARVSGQLIVRLCSRQKMTIRPPEYKPPPRTTYTDLGWIFAALTGPATLLAVWIYCAVTYDFFLGFGLGWIPALILALLVAVATIFLWPLVAVAVLYVIYRVFGVHPELLTYIAAFVGIIAIAMICWWHVAKNKF